MRRLDEKKFKKKFKKKLTLKRYRLNWQHFNKFVVRKKSKLSTCNDVQSIDNNTFAVLPIFQG